jgi:hypothetical protein
MRAAAVVAQPYFAAAFVALAVLATASPATGAEGPEHGTWSVVVENDLFYDRDRDYTSGVALVWAPATQRTANWAVRIAQGLPWWPEERRVHRGFAIAQNIYTPRDTSLPDPPRDDRPYAGWLYGTIGLGVERGRRLDQFGLTLGVVGPASLAEDSQRLVHEVRNLDLPQGWDTQLGNELGLMVSHQRSWRGLAATRLAGLDFDLTPHLGGTLGNVYTYGTAGATLRWGKHLPRDYGPPRIQPSVPGSGLVVATDALSGYLFAGVEGRAVARNIFLDGNTFRDSRSVDKEPLVGDLQWGVVLTWRGLRLAYTHVLRTMEFEGQDGHDEFGAVILAMPL